MALGVSSSLQSSLHISITLSSWWVSNGDYACTSAGMMDKPSQWLRVDQPLLSKLGYFMQRSW